MRSLITILVCVCVLTMFSGCQIVQSPAVGVLDTDAKAPLAATAHSGYSKVGKASVQSILGLVATGDASIEAAAKSANITKIHHVDYESTNILGIVGTFTTVVYGD
ncbi:MAG TPA: TRL-like family protein [Planctomycetota bacterium]|nr:TRL-like family protein [Planctomycetota bacterium]